MYCPVLFRMACSCPTTSTVDSFPGKATCGRAGVTCGSLVKIVTAGPGCQVRLALWVRYCLATRKLLIALASRKFVTTSFGFQPGCGPRTSSPQQGPAPGGGPGAEAGCGPVPEGMNEHPPASAAAATSPVTRAVRRRGRQETAGRRSGIAAPRLGTVTGGISHGRHAIGGGDLLIRAQRQGGSDKLPAHSARQREPEDRAPSPLPPGLQPARVQPGVLQ